MAPGGGIAAGGSGVTIGRVMGRISAARKAEHATQGPRDETPQPVRVTKKQPPRRPTDKEWTGSTRDDRTRSAHRTGARTRSIRHSKAEILTSPASSRTHLRDTIQRISPLPLAGPPRVHGPSTQKIYLLVSKTTRRKLPFPPW